MPQRPDGKAAKTERVTFTKPAAERIAKVVRTVEGGDRQSAGLYFGQPGAASGGKLFRVCTFTGSWEIGSSKTVTFKNQTATPNTVAAQNLFWPLPDGGQRDCAIAKDGTAWFLLVPRLYGANAATAAEITTTAIVFKTMPVPALATAGTSTFTLSITTCATATATP